MLIQQQVSLKEFNSFGLDSIASHFCEPSSVDDLKQAFIFSQENNLPVYILGGGSNVLFSSPEITGLMIHLRLFGRFISESEAFFTVKASASENWNDFVGYCIDNGIVGLENLSLIPGTVGACPVQNIGAYGVEVAEFIESVTCFDVKTGVEVVLLNEECRFAYRDSVFKRACKHLVILSVQFCFPKNQSLRLNYGDVSGRVEYRLKKDEKSGLVTARLVSDVISEIRSEKLPDPAVLGNAGSFFKNPIISQEVYLKLKADFPLLVAYPHGERFKVAAGWLIDQIGFRGYQLGGAAVHDKQALVLVNKTGFASIDELFQLVDLIREKVRCVYGLELEVEPVKI